MSIVLDLSFEIHTIKEASHYMHFDVFITMSSYLYTCSSNKPWMKYTIIALKKKAHGSVAS